MSTTPWHIHLFGVVTASRDGRVITAFRTQQTARVLARLAYLPDRPCRRDELIEMIWPDVDPALARNRLNVALSSLRHDLGSRILLPAASTGKNCIQLDKRVFTTDASQFESLLHDIDPESSPEIQIVQYEKALSLYTGEVLAGIDDVWALGERQRASDRFISSILSISKLLIDAGRHRQALDLVRRGTQYEPLREDLHRLLIRLLCGLGQRSEAAREHGEFVHLLEHDYGISASKTTLDTVNFLLFDNPQIEPESQAPVIPSSPDSRAEKRTKIPLDSDPLFGRDECVLDVASLLMSAEVRLVSLTGMGGTGKSRLAEAALAALANVYGDERWFVLLANASEPQHIEQAILRKIGIRVDARTNIHLQLVNVLSKGPALLVLDNMEQLLPAGAAVVMSLLNALPQLKCLVTSRQRLNLSIEHERPVTPLQTPSKSGSPNSLIEFPSVQLFMHRAALVSHGFEITRDNADCLAAICHHLEGLPLAIEMAAAWTRVMSPAEILSRLTPRLPLLISRDVDACDRHASVRRTLESSFDQMPMHLKRVFARLSVFRGGWSTEAAIAVADSNTVLADLMDLRDHSVLKVSSESGQIRISYLEVVREFAAELLELSDEGAAVRAAHAKFFRNLAESAMTHLRGQHASQWLDTLDAEHENLRQALTWSLNGDADVGCAANSGIRLAIALWRYWLQRGNLVEGIQWMLSARALAGDSEPALQAQLKVGLGILSTTAGDYENARAVLHESIDLFRSAADLSGETEALNALGSLAFVLGDWNAASSHYERGLNLAVQLGDACTEGRILSNLASVAARMGNTDTAAVYFDRSLDILGSTSDTHTLASVMANSIPTLLMRNELDAAEKRLASCIELSIGSGYPRILAHCFEGVAEISVRQDRSRDAVVMFAAASSIRKRIGAPLPISHRAAYEADYDQLRIALKSESFEEAWMLGSHLSDDAAAGWCASRLQVQPERVPSR